MYINKLRINYFGKFKDLEIELKPGINLIYGENEAGKSTIHTFIKGIFFGIERLRGRAANSRDDIYNRYLPWSYPGAYGGSMDITINEKQYRLQRSFHISDKKFTIIDLVSGREINLKEGHISELIAGLTEATYNNTVSIGQLKASTDTQFASQVQNYIANLSVAKSNEVDVTKAVKYLNNKKKSLESKQIITQLKDLQELIDEEMAKEEKIEELSVKLKTLLSEERKLIKENNRILHNVQSDDAQQWDRLPAILENYRIYKQMIKEGQQLEQQYSETQKQLSIIESDISSNLSLKEDIKEAEQCMQDLSLYKGLLSEKSRQKEERRRSHQSRSIFITIVPTIAIALLTLFLGKFKGLAIPVSILILIIGFVFYNLIRARFNLSLKTIDSECESYEMQINALGSKLKHICKKYMVDGTDKLIKKQEEYLKNYYTLDHGKEQLKSLKKRMDDLEDSRDELYEIIMKYMVQFIHEDILTDETIEKLAITIRHQKEEMLQKQQEVSRQLENCRISIERLRWELSDLEDNERLLQKHMQKYNELLNKHKEDEIELQAVMLALETIEELSIEIHDDFGMQLNEEVSRIIRNVTNNKYKDIKLDEKLDLKVGWEGDYIPISKLSFGTMDQLYFALRMAVADLLLGQEEMPLLLDDSFAFYDDNRLKSALLYLASRKQVLLFTCHTREERVLAELQIPYNKVIL